MRSRLETLVKRPISIVDLFRYPTVHALARFLGDGAEQILCRRCGSARKQRDAVSELAADGRGRKCLIPNGARPPESIAIIGMSGRFPKARNLDEFWRNLEDGAE